MCWTWQSEFGAGLKPRASSRSAQERFFLNVGGPRHFQIEKMATGQIAKFQRIGEISKSVVCERGVSPIFQGVVVNLCARCSTGEGQDEDAEMSSAHTRRCGKDAIVQPKGVKEGQKRLEKKVPEREFRFVSVLCLLLQNQQILCRGTRGLRTKRRLERRRGVGDGQ